ncbi:hypothetical protein C2845_PM08G00570 [Panicum miliaceum]|uniref:Nucleoside phosphorylase domain-containing protein n=1 Tax=Panicum miliaceum TaxID=4540 RepID=A0A3L6QYN0_PANMI|nr:hypothetical protein C2845_PM08G00570 [Panicum miliaceum]
MSITSYRDRPIVDLQLAACTCSSQLLLSLFKVKGVVHWGIAGNANEDLQIGDVTIPQHWAHLSLWNWQRHGERAPARGRRRLHQARQHAFWVPVSKRYYDLAGKLEGLELPACLPRPPKVARVPRGCSANVYTDNASYRQFLRAHFRCTPVEMESAAVALVAHQLGVPFLTIRSLSDLAGGGSSLSNEAATFLAIAAQNAVDVMLKFVPLLAAAGENARLLPEDV